MTKQQIQSDLEKHAGHVAGLMADLGTADCGPQDLHRLINQTEGELMTALSLIAALRRVS